MIGFKLSFLMFSIVIGFFILGVFLKTEDKYGRSQPLFLAILNNATTTNNDTICNEDKLLLAYPDFLERFDGNVLVWKDSTRMIYDDSIGTKDWFTLQNYPDLQDQFYLRYKKGIEYDTPSYHFNPGTVRYEPFFKKMYGYTQKEVEANLVSVPWLPSFNKTKLKVTRVNGIAEKIAAISNELETMPEFKQYLVNPGGAYNWRVILNTTQMSLHSFGIAIDINVKYSHYWRWEKNIDPENIKYKNLIPTKIVEVFEKYGFIWGGKWYNYDTMHFEYRPELTL